jgi:hypothetical protein
MNHRTLSTRYIRDRIEIHTRTISFLTCTCLLSRCSFEPLTRLLLFYSMLHGMPQTCFVHRSVHLKIAVNVTAVCSNSSNLNFHSRKNCRNCPLLLSPTTHSPIFFARWTRPIHSSFPHDRLTQSFWVSWWQDMTMHARKGRIQWILILNIGNFSRALYILRRRQVLASSRCSISTRQIRGRN